MNRLFLTLATALVIALSASLAVSWWLTENPLFRADDPAIAQRLKQVGIELQATLAAIPESQWDDAIFASGYDEHYDIDWYSAEEYTASIEMRTELFAQHQMLSYEWNDNPLYEILFTELQLVLQIVPFDGVRRALNNAVTVLAILAIGVITAAIALVPVARRLRQLQRQANAYGRGNWDIAPVDNAKDAIGDLSAAMQEMADKIRGLVMEKNSLVNDQRDLMQAVAHEFRGPMARMRFALELAEDDADNEQHRQALNQALEELNDMISEVLIYARLQISSPDLSFKSLVLSELITDVRDKHRYLSKASSIDIEIQSPEYPIQADATQLQRALYNLIGNALKYGADYARVTVINNGDTVTVHVDDKGPGITPAERQRALKPFVRLDSSRSRQLGGSGLGLAIANGVARKHGGSLIIRDNPDGHGARLSLTIPVQQAEKPL